jgi:bifunctional DNA-binding transcriptional regulator/antitoxin component of YhaV-PrlF toxin-antitoxin module
MAEKYIHKIRKISKYTYSLVLPISLMKKFGWKEKQKVVISDKGRKRLEIKDWKK